MKTTSRLLKAAAATLILAIIPAVPSFAVTTTADTGGTCAHIATLQSTSLAAVSAKAGAMSTDFKNRLTGITANQQAVDQKVAAARQTTLANFQARITKLLAIKNLTDTQKQAITTFQTEVQTAEKTRQTAIDQARDAYRTALLVAVQTHQSDLTDAVASFQDSVTAAFGSAEASCNAGQSAVTTLKTAIASDRSTLKTAIAASKTSANIQQLITTRNNLFKAANTTFVSTITTDTKTLQSALE